MAGTEYSPGHLVPMCWLGTPGCFSVIAPPSQHVSPRLPKWREESVHKHTRLVNISPPDSPLPHVSLAIAGHMAILLGQFLPKELSRPRGQREKVRIRCQCTEVISTMHSCRRNINNMIPQIVFNVESLTETIFLCFAKVRKIIYQHFLKF